MPRRRLADPVRLREIAETTMRRLDAAPAGTPSVRLLADQTARVLGGAVDALNALALLAGRRRYATRSAGVPSCADFLQRITSESEAKSKIV
jgi:hypothetical protein